MEEIQLYLSEALDLMSKAVRHTEIEFSKIRAGKASPNMVYGLTVDYYGTITPIEQISSINTTDARTLVIKPWEKNMLNPIERSIINSDLGLNPMNDGEYIRLMVPPLTEERRKDLVKQTKAEAEAGKIAIRNIRKDINNDLKKLQKDGVSEDLIKVAEDDVQKMTDKHIKIVDDLFTKKEVEIMTV